MPAFIDRTGVRYGRLTCIRYIKGSRWVCKCDCGKEKEVLLSSLLSGKTRSCGCLHTDSHTTHGMTKTSEYQAWNSMLRRCESLKGTEFRNYTSRGITVCARWKESFENFLEDMGMKPSKSYSIDRIDNNLGYSCGHCSECLSKNLRANCRWATKTQQSRNTRLTTWATLGDETLPIAELADRLGICVPPLKERIKRHGAEVALSVGKLSPGKRITK